jgi:hypothetical protein
MQGPASASAALTRATLLRSRERRTAAACWRSFATGRFDQLPTSGTRFDWFSAPRTASLLFPRLSDDSVRLSRFDSVLLGSFEDWTRPSEAVSKETVDVLFAFGDLLIEYRARQWTRQESGVVALESRRVEAGQGVLGRHAYRLTSEGRRRLERGLSGVMEAPAFEVGGAVAYARQRPWLVIEEGDGWSWIRATA